MGEMLQVASARGRVVRRGMPLALAVLSLVVALFPATEVQAAGAFIDDDGNAHEPSIEAIADAGVTTGCSRGPQYYCPGDPVTRGQMASFLVRAFGLPLTSVDYFDDDTGSVHEAAINAVARAGVTQGLDPQRYGPDLTVTRAQMASFIARVLDLSATAGDIFDDDDGSIHETNIDAIASEGITLGCDASGTRYCPAQNVQRDQMASFLARAMDLVGSDNPGDPGDPGGPGDPGDPGDPGPPPDPGDPVDPGDPGLPPDDPPYEIDVNVPAGADIQSYVDANPAGTVFGLASGVYRQQSIEPKDGQVFVGSSDGTVLNGSKVISDWAYDGNRWVSTGHSEDGYRFGECADGGSACTYPEDLFVDNVGQTRVTSLGDVESGTWYFDNGADTIYMGTDPTGHEVELSSTRWAFNGPVDGVTVYGMTIEMYASSAQEGAVNARDGREETTNGWVVENNLIRWNHGYGVRGSNTTAIRNNVITQNGQIGVGGDGVDMLVEGNEISYNNYAGFRLDWEAGGTKFVDTDGLVFRDNWSHHNVGSGIWTDENNINVTIEDNVITDNGRSGIHHEVSYSAVIRNNVVEGNGYLKPNWVWGAGILVDISRDVEVYGNVVRDNANGITGVFQHRDENASGVHGEWDLRNLHVHDNCIEMNGPKFGFPDENPVTGIAQDAGNTAVYNSDNNRFENNTYVLGTDVNNGDFYRWDDVLRNSTEWQNSADQDATGTWATSCAGF